MRFKQLNIEINHLFWIEPLDSKGISFKQGDLGQLRLSSRTGQLQLVIHGKLFTITLREPILFNEIVLGFDRANANLVEVSRVHRQRDWRQKLSRKFPWPLSLLILKIFSLGQLLNIIIFLNKFIIICCLSDKSRLPLHRLNRFGMQVLQKSTSSCPFLF